MYVTAHILCYFVLVLCIIICIIITEFVILLLSYLFVLCMRVAAPLLPQVVLRNMELKRWGGGGRDRGSRVRWLDKNCITRSLSNATVHGKW
jgi:hypothetical protein